MLNNVVLLRKSIYYTDSTQKTFSKKSATSNLKIESTVQDLEFVFLSKSGNGEPALR